MKRKCIKQRLFLRVAVPLYPVLSIQRVRVIFSTVQIVYEISGVRLMPQLDVQISGCGYHFTTSQISKEQRDKQIINTHDPYLHNILVSLLQHHNNDARAIIATDQSQVYYVIAVQLERYANRRSSLQVKSSQVKSSQMYYPMVGN